MAVEDAVFSDSEVHMGDLIVFHFHPRIPGVLFPEIGLELDSADRLVVAFEAVIFRVGVAQVEEQTVAGSLQFGLAP